MADQYPLQELVTIKKNRFDTAVKVLEQKKEILEKEYEKLYDVTQERDNVLSHRKAKLQQLRDGLDEGIAMHKIEQMKLYLKVVDEKLLEKEKKVVEQQKRVDQAQHQVDLATEELFQRKKDLEKLEIHRGEWEKEMRYEQEKKEEVVHDEQGASVFEQKKREHEMRKKGKSR